MTFQQFLAILRARWVVAFVVFSVIAGGTLLVSLLLPKTYSATASVVIDMKPDPLGAFAATALLTPSMVETQVDIVQSDRVASRVVRNLNLSQNPQIRAQWMDSTKGEGDFDFWLAETFQRSLDVRPSRSSGVVSITYRAPDARFAGALANAFAKAYLEVALELRVDPARQYTAFFDKRSKEAREMLEQAQAKATAFQRENSLLATDERLDIETARLNELSTQLVLLQGLSSESGIRQTQAQSSGADKMQEVLANPLIGSLKADLSRAEARQKELGARFGDSHPQMVEARASIDELKAKIDAETRRVVGGVGVSNTISKQRETEIRASLDAQRAKVLKLKAIRDESNVLQREAENAQLAYQQVVARMNQTSLESQSNQTNISLLSEARIPNQPSAPRILLNTALASILGFVLAIAAALGVESVDRRVRLPADIVDAVGLPIIGSIVKPRARRWFGRGRESTMQRQLLVAATGGGKRP